MHCWITLWGCSTLCCSWRPLSGLFYVFIMSQPSGNGELTQWEVPGLHWLRRDFFWSECLHSTPPVYSVHHKTTRPGRLVMGDQAGKEARGCADWGKWEFRQSQLPVTCCQGSFMSCLTGTHKGGLGKPQVFCSSRKPFGKYCQVRANRDRMKRTRKIRVWGYGSQTDWRALFCYSKQLLN